MRYERRDAVMREADPSMRISRQFPVENRFGSPSGAGYSMFRWPDKMILEGDAVCWDICMRYEGYAIDISRTRTLGRASPDIRQAYQAALHMSEGLIEAARPGLPAVQLEAFGARNRQGRRV